MVYENVGFYKCAFHLISSQLLKTEPKHSFMFLFVPKSDIQQVFSPPGDLVPTFYLDTKIHCNDLA